MQCPAAGAPMSRAAPVILALDCSGAACSVALWRDAALAGHRFEAMARGQAEALMPMVAATMAAAACAFAELDLVAVTVGPGSFTGLRIGLAAARGIALAAGVPALGVTSFAAIAEALPPLDAARAFAIAIDDRRGGAYWQVFDAGRSPLEPPRALAAETLPEALAAAAEGRALLFAGDGAGRLREVQARAGAAAAALEIDAGRAGPIDAADVARLAARLAPDRLRAGAAGMAPMAAPTPLYLRAPDAQLPDPAIPGR